MGQFLLIHGSWHGAWCWYKVAPRLRAAGHQVEVVDLPGRGPRRRPAFTIGLSALVDAAWAALPEEGTTTVVAHSRGGIVASALAERAPERIARTIYLAAFLLPDGGRVLDHWPDPGSALPGRVKVDRLRLQDHLEPAAYREALYADCSADDLALAQALLGPEPVRPALTRLRLTSRYRSVPRAYVRLTQDRAVSLPLQDRLLGAGQVDRVESLAASHSAYFSQPDRLASVLAKIAGA